MTGTDHLIWSNYHLDYEDWKEDLEAEYPDFSDEDRYLKMLEINNAYLDDERVNLNIQLSQAILIIADLGLWDGRHSGYKEIRSGNIKDCLFSNYDYATWYVDKNGDLRCDVIHHDGTNHLLYRVFKDDATADQRHRLEKKIFMGTATRADITRVTSRLGDEIGKVYGWEFPQRTAQKTYER
ncbi:hypothetical protein [Papillibacter cinnamivorans]|uniref:Uncharacterized protein n=1 Tax=Papillibacter cinnamivorans DSM 12816 TaxID=1122930 RepID=A0A1W2APU4_9FIRM|nr:hypothetical protein [Papillibacter cinnamivorans]SMC62471.1 hypothetical protein SAMN02745168_1880 [Papillibacter cinnamivorans DSM 12816]